VYTGRLDYVGGIEVLLEAISNLPSDIRNKFVITGYGGLKEQVVAHANELNIKFKGFLSEADYDSLLSSAKISINPLRS
ncbi:glycosyltransferase, partial [Escherichia coli]|nr:glycosyltransferase [Escherichia coli]